MSADPQQSFDEDSFDDGEVYGEDPHSEDEDGEADGETVTGAREGEETEMAKMEHLGGEEERKLGKVSKSEKFKSSGEKKRRLCQPHYIN